MQVQKSLLHFYPANLRNKLVKLPKFLFFSSLSATFLKFAGHEERNGISKYIKKPAEKRQVNIINFRGR